MILSGERTRCREGKKVCFLSIFQENSAARACDETLMTYIGRPESNAKQSPPPRRIAHLLPRRESRSIRSISHHLSRRSVHARFRHPLRRPSVSRSHWRMEDLSEGSGTSVGIGG